MTWPEAFATTAVLVTSIIAVEQVVEKGIEAVKEIGVARLLSRARYVVLHDKDS